MNKKIIALMMALVLILGAAIGGTLAWLTAKTEDVVNTFTPSDINIDLTETTTEFKMVPGHTIAKDPAAKVLDGSEDCWLFVKLVKSDNYGKYLKDYEMAEGWEKVEDGVYGRKVYKIAENKSFPVLKNDQVEVLSSVTKDDMEALIIRDEEGKVTGYKDRPTLTVTAYATQLFEKNGVEFSIKKAWENAPKS